MAAEYSFPLHRLDVAVHEKCADSFQMAGAPAKRFILRFGANPISMHLIFRGQLRSGTITDSILTALDHGNRPGNIFNDTRIFSRANLVPP